MKKTFYILLFLYFNITENKFQAQNHIKDSLHFALKNAKNDTTRCNILNAMIEDENNDTIWSKYNFKLKTLAENGLKNFSPSQREYHIFIKHYTNALNNFGTLHFNKGEIPQALKYYNKCLKIQEDIGDRKGVAQSLNEIGYIYQNQGNIDKALKYFYKCLKISTEINEDGLIHISYNSIGSIYADQKDFLKALEYYNKSLELADRINDKEGVGVSLNNIGAIYKELKDFSNALKYFSKSLKIFEELENSYGVSSLLDNMGVIYQYQGNMTKSMDCFVKSLKLCEELDDKSGVASSLNNIGTNYIAQKKYNKALDYCSKSMEMSMELGFPESIKVSANKLSIIYQQQGNYKKALEMRNLEILMKDSLNNEATQKATAQQQAKYEYEKQKAIDDATHDKQIALEQEEQKKQQIISVSIGMGLFLVVIFLAFVFNRLQVTRKQKIVIEQQRDLVEHAHKEIKDSINYAERIQRSFLATSDLLNENLKDYFVFFQPKDVVSGDFYWAGKLTNNQFAILNADSTGHGVPGAIMSILNISSIEKAVEKGITNPAQIFNDTRKTIIERLKKDGSLDGGKDGMDATMISFDFANNKLNYVAAQNPIWIIRNNNLIEIKPEKIPVGKHDNDNIPFIGGEFETKKGDVIYTLTDGFQDQFGGENGKKFKVKPFKTFLISISHLPMNKQKEKIEETFINWKGKEEQVDDVCIVGIKI